MSLDVEGRVKPMWFATAESEAPLWRSTKAMARNWGTVKSGVLRLRISELISSMIKGTTSISSCAACSELFADDILIAQRND